MELKIGQCSEQGPYRDTNEDAVHVAEFAELTVCLVADGMGAGGAVASQQAVQVVGRELGRRLQLDTESNGVRIILRDCLNQANAELLALQRLDPGIRHMAASLCLLAWHGREVILTAVGDSIAYRLRERRIEVAFIDPEVRRLHEYLTAARRAGRWVNVAMHALAPLGAASFDYHEEPKFLELQSGDCFVLCTDGLHSILAEADMLRCIRQHPDPQHCAEALCQLALERGSRDNVSCIVVAVE